LETLSFKKKKFPAQQFGNFQRIEFFRIHLTIYLEIITLEMYCNQLALLLTLTLTITLTTATPIREGIRAVSFAQPISNADFIVAVDSMSLPPPPPSPKAFGMS
jgi:hypothetical protein